MVTTIGPALAQAATRLALTSRTPRLDAELLMAHALETTREAVLLGAPDAAVPEDFAALLARRLAGEPIAYITGSRAFWTIDLRVGPGVLIPRPASETLIEAAVAHFSEAGPACVLDLGTGSGALLLAALDQWPQATGLGVDRSPAALAIAADNAARLGLAERATLAQGYWSVGIREQFDLVLCNPPYIQTDAILARDIVDHEPHGALFAGADGLDDYRQLAPVLGGLIAPGGIACLEIGTTQAARVTALMEVQGLVSEVRRDLAGHDRCLVVQPR